MTAVSAPEPSRGERGQVLVLFALALVVFLGAAALTIDFGTWLSARRGYQNAVDPAVLAGASFLTRPLNDTTLCGSPKPICARRATWGYLNDQIGLGLFDATMDGYASANTAAAGQAVVPASGGSAFTIWVSTPPPVGSYASESTVQGRNGIMFARVDRRNEAFLARVMGFVDQNISAWATAGTFPNRWAVITLRRGRGASEIDQGPANTTDIKLAGTTSRLNVIDGDVGGNWGMKLTGTSQIRVWSTTGDDAAVYLTDYQSCGNSCWTNGQIADQFGNDLSGTYPPSGAKKLPGFIADPSYAAPPASSWPTSCIVACGTASATIPKGASTPVTGPNSYDVDIRASDPGSVSGASCSADSPVIGPGWYDDINVAADHCLKILGNVQRTNMFDPATQTFIPQLQQPGIVYVTGDMNINNNALVVADGVTIVMRGTAHMIPSQAVIDINRNLADASLANSKYAAWTTKGVSSWVWNATLNRYVYRTGFNPNIDGVGIAIYVLKPSQYGATDANGTDVIEVAAHSGLAWSGVTYAANDNVKIAGQPSHAGIGQLISWTFTFDGGTVVTQTFDGPSEGLPFLIEPCVLVGGACQ